MNDNKKIAINTTILYAKLIINIVVSFITARLVLQALGASDYGLYNVVGGVVAMLNTLGTSMVATSYRYMTVEIGKGKTGNPNKIYNTLFVVHAVLALSLLFIGETLGVYYVNNILNVDLEKIPDAMFVLHLSLITTAFAIITVPMNGLIIAREKFLFVSIIESLSAIVKLLLIFWLLCMDGNRLRIYAVMLACVQLISPVAYQFYSRIKDKDIVLWHLNRNKADYKGVIGFSWWMSFGVAAVMGKMQGAAMIINFFFGTILNTAFGLASQVSNAVGQFTSTLRQAALPQIMKSQSSGNEARSLNLVYSMSRYSYLCMNIMAIPLLLCMEDVLTIWLGTIPQFTKIFVVFMLINGMVSNLGAGFDASIQATGKVRKNQIGYSLINLSLLPIIFLLYKMGLPPYINVIVMVLLTICTLVFQIHIMTRLTSFSLSEYYKRTLLPSLMSTLLSFAPLVPVRLVFIHSYMGTFIFLIIAAIWTMFSIYIAGMNKREKELIILFVSSKICKNK